MNKQFLGNYRGIVVDNNGDKGRCRIYIPGVHPEEFEKDPTALQWAEPAMSLFGGNYSGSGTNPQTGVCTTPHIGTNVWVFFEQGNYNFPIYFAACQGGEGWFASGNNQHCVKTDNVSVVVSENGADTRVEIIATGNISLKIIGNVTEQIIGNVDRYIKGDVTENIIGNVTRNVVGNEQETIIGMVDKKIVGENTDTVIGNSTQMVALNWSRITGINLSEVVFGNYSCEINGISTSICLGSWFGTINGPYQLQSFSLENFVAPIINLN